MKPTKETIAKLKELKNSIANSKPIDEYFWTEGMDDDLRIIDNKIEELEEILEDVLWMHHFTYGNFIQRKGN